MMKIINPAGNPTEVYIFFSNVCCSCCSCKCKTSLLWTTFELANSVAIYFLICSCSDYQFASVHEHGHGHEQEVE